MTASPLSAMLAEARTRGYAVVACNVVDAISMAAAIRASVSQASPVIVQTSAVVARRFGPDVIAAAFRRIAAPLGGSVALQLDHCGDEALVQACVEAGWDGVMFDASAAGPGENRERTRAVVEMAHAAGVTVEGELEAIGGHERGVHSSDGRLGPVEASVAFVDATGIDAFAPAFGNVHGRTEAPPQLDTVRLARVAAGTNVPLVLHGGTGLGQAMLTDVIAAGIAKVNVSTDLREAYLGAARAYTADEQHDDPIAMFDGIEAAVAATVERYMALCGSVGRAAGVATSAAVR